MKTTSFSFELPDHLIAQKPTERRDHARLMVSDRGTVSHRFVTDLPEVVPAGAVVVVNDSRVRKARIYARRRRTDSARADSSNTRGTSGVELLFLEPLTRWRWKVLARRPGRNPQKKRYVLPENIAATLVPNGDEFILETQQPLDEAYFERHGHVPLPPYIARPDEVLDEDRYQTVFARHYGSAAAPTAGLHLTEDIINRLRAKGVEIAEVTLHVGSGTFAPVRTERVEDHQMHSERFEVPEATARTVNNAKRDGRPIVAIGTTCVRTLESAWRNGRLQATREESDLFIYPGYRFTVVDELLTNFHTPKSSLLMLVSAFAGVEHIRELYKTAVEREYRFFSYGDAMYLRP